MSRRAGCRRFRGRRRLFLCMVLGRRIVRLCGRSTRLVWLGFRLRLVVRVEGCSRRGGRRLCRTRRLPRRVRGRGDRRCQSHRRGKTVCFEFLSLKCDHRFSHGCLPGCGPVDSDFVYLGRIISDVLDMAEDMSSTILGNKVSEICAQTHEYHCRLVASPFFNWKIFKKNESFPIEHFVSCSGEELAKLGQREVFLKIE